MKKVESESSHEPPQIEDAGYWEGWLRLMYATANMMQILIANMKTGDYDEKLVYINPVRFYKEAVRPHLNK